MTHYRVQEWPAGLFPEPDAKKRAGGDGKNRQIRGGSRSSPLRASSGRDPVWLTPVARCLETAMAANCSAYDHRI